MKTSQRGALVSAALAGLLVLGGCTSLDSGDMSSVTGSGGSSTSSGGDPGSNSSDGMTTTVFTTPTGDVVSKDGGVLTATGGAVSGFGSTIGGSNLPGASESGNVVDNVSETVSALGTDVQPGLGSIDINSNPTDTMALNISNVVTQTGNTADVTGASISSFGSGPLQPPLPVTLPVSGTVSQIEQAVAGVGDMLGMGLSVRPVEQVTQQLSSTVVSLTSQMITATQTLGSAMGLGVPMTNLLQAVGSGVANIGTSLMVTSTPVASGSGDVVTATGSTVVALGGVTSMPGGTTSVNPLTPTAGTLGDAAGGGTTAGGATTPVGSFIAIIGTSLTFTGAATPLAPVTGAVGGTLITVGGTLHH